MADFAPDLSIVATIYNDADVIPRLVTEIDRAISGLGIRHEIILVDDHSMDTSRQVLEAESKRFPHVRGLALSRNFGQQIAISAGIHMALGDRIIIMDGDLQNPPDAIPSLYRKLDEGYDIVYAVSKVRNNWLDALLSYLFWLLMSKGLGINVIRHQLMMRAMNRKFVDTFKLYGESVRLIMGITHDIGMRSAAVAVENRKRASGRSNYNILRRLSIFVDIVLLISNRPLNFMLYAGFLCLLGTTVSSVIYLYIYLFDVPPPGYTSVILSIFFFGSLNVIMLGVVGRYLSNIYIETRRRPLYLIEAEYKS
jgi:dolichol-phosphate mannosyltransferase